MEARAALHRRWDADAVAAGVAALGLAAVAAGLLLDLGAPTAPRTAPVAVARLEGVEGSVRWRAAGTLAWDAAGPEQPLAAGDAVFVQPGAVAALAFRTGARVDLDERTLVVVEPPEGEADRVRLLSGGALAEAGSAPLDLRTARTRAIVAPRAAVEAAAAGPVEVLEGSARVDGQERAASPRVGLAAPPRNDRLYAASFPETVTLRWDGGAARDATLEVSRERSFASVVATAPGAPGTLALAVRGAGAWYWRLVDRAGAPVSEVRKLTAVEDRPPRPYAPAAGELVLAPRGVQVPFWWTAVSGSARYRVEVAPDASFQRVALSEPASGPGLWAALDLPEGVYHWRVRAERLPAGRTSPPSAAIPFRLVHRPLLDAPQLFDATIERGDHAR